MIVFVIGCDDGKADGIKKAILDSGNNYVQTSNLKKAADKVENDDIVLVDGETLLRMLNSGSPRQIESKISETLSVVARCNASIRGLLNERFAG